MSKSLRFGNYTGLNQSQLIIRAQLEPLRLTHSKAGNKDLNIVLTQSEVAEDLSQDHFSAEGLSKPRNLRGKMQQRSGTGNSNSVTLSTSMVGQEGVNKYNHFVKGATGSKEDQGKFGALLFRLNRLYTEENELTKQETQKMYKGEGAIEDTKWCQGRRGGSLDTQAGTSFLLGSSHEHWQSPCIHPFFLTYPFSLDIVPTSHGLYYHLPSSTSQIDVPNTEPSPPFVCYMELV